MGDIGYKVFVILARGTYWLGSDGFLEYEALVRKQDASVFYEIPKDISLWCGDSVILHVGSERVNYEFM